MRRKFAVVALAATLLSATAPVAAVANSTGVPGQPGQDCEQLGTPTPGFQTSAFQNIATQVYAGSGPGSAHSANPDKAVSQYDVACFQQFSHTH